MEEKEPTPPKAQQAFLLCSADRVTLSNLVQELGYRFIEAACAATILLYGVTPKQQYGFVIIEAMRGITPALLAWLQRDLRIVEYTVYDVPSAAQFRVGGQDAVAHDPHWYRSHLPAPTAPAGYELLSTPTSIDPPSDERWIALAASEEGNGLLFYEAQRALLFLTNEEAMHAAICLFCLSATLQDCLPAGYAQAYAEQLAALRAFLSPPSAFCHANSLEELDAWCAQHGLRLVPNDDGKEAAL